MCTNLAHSPNCLKSRAELIGDQFASQAAYVPGAEGNTKSRERPRILPQGDRRRCVYPNLVHSPPLRKPRTEFIKLSTALCQSIQSLCAHLIFRPWDSSQTPVHLDTCQKAISMQLADQGGPVRCCCSQSFFVQNRARYVARDPWRCEEQFTIPVRWC